MTPPIPLNLVNVNADSITRGVTLALPKATVRDFLPAGLELCDQDVTDAGTHPVTLLFNEMFRVQMSIPTLCPSQTYREHIVGIPYTYLSRQLLTPGNPGPYYFMPKLYLDSFIATLTGVAVWGYAKEMGSMNITADRHTVTNLAGQRLTSLVWQKKDERIEWRPVVEFPLFESTRLMLNQPIISMLPAAVGPLFVVSDFVRDWDVAMLQPLRTAVEVDVAYVPGYECGRYPAAGWSPGIDEQGLGSYVFHAPWRLGLPYSPLVTFR